MVDVIIEFVGGGPVDGKVMCSDSQDEAERDKMRWLSWMVGVALAYAQQKEIKPASLLTYRQPSAVVVAKAKEEGWSEARIAAMMPYYEYEFTDCRQEGNIAWISARFSRIND